MAHSFPVGQEASFADIAAATGLDEGTVRRFIRHATVRDIFSEPRSGIVVHNAVSRLLAEDQVIHDWVGNIADDLWQAAAQTCNALDKWPASQEPNHSVCERQTCFGHPDHHKFIRLTPHRGSLWRTIQTSQFSWSSKSFRSVLAGSQTR